ncbi:MAG: hypothetical protein ACRDTO_00325 [Mycobacterium sp.]
MPAVNAAPATAFAILRIGFSSVGLAMGMELPYAHRVGYSA